MSDFLWNKQQRFLWHKQCKLSTALAIEVPTTQVTEISIAQTTDISMAQATEVPMAIQVLPQVQNSNKVRTSRLSKLKPHTQTYPYPSETAPFKPPYPLILRC
ncbi:hypothetical protein F8M41_025020 [Gigaspora margarita]|uniref:Uncharacterized protein n=1 Tax=Gigaspora margarita TaxID=4874 RepID=A0A8H3XJB4_GIGMA|nr:hypothetical protein F8M41_025020 [Gigaspora margarita]